MTDRLSSPAGAHSAGAAWRPLAVAVLWTFAAAAAGGAMVGIVSLIAGGVAATIWVFDRTVSIAGAMGDTVRIAAWVFAPIGLAVTVWVAAYGTTREGSIPRVLLAAPAAIAVAVALLFLDSSGLLVAGLAIGWALAMPFGSPTHVAVRALPLLVAALFFPRFDDLPVWTVIWILVASPAAAALAVYVGDLLWGVRRKPLAGFDP